MGIKPEREIHAQYLQTATAPQPNLLKASMTYAITANHDEIPRLAETLKHPINGTGPAPKGLLLEQAQESSKRNSFRAGA